MIRNAGARVTNDVFRSLSVMGTIAPIDFIAISHHTGMRPTSYHIRSTDSGNFDTSPVD